MTEAFRVYVRNETTQELRLIGAGIDRKYVAAIMTFSTGSDDHALSLFEVVRESEPESSAISGVEWMRRYARDLTPVSVDLVVSELIKDQRDNNPPTNESGRLSALMIQQQVRSALLLVEALGFVIAKEVDSVATS